jgi:hypothetical protein
VYRVFKHGYRIKINCMVFFGAKMSNSNNKLWNSSIIKVVPIKFCSFLCYNKFGQLSKFLFSNFSIDKRLSVSLLAFSQLCKTSECEAVGCVNCVGVICSCVRKMVYFYTWKDVYTVEHLDFKVRYALTFNKFTVNSTVLSIMIIFLFGTQTFENSSRSVGSAA